MTASGSTTACPMGKGILVRDYGRAAGSAYRVMIKNHSAISHALCGLDMGAGPFYADARDYFIDQSTFVHNLTHVSDQAQHDGTQVSLITNCTFASDPAQMHYPYDQTTPNEAYYTYQALLLLPTGTVNSNAVEVRNNTFNGAVYGIVNNVFDQVGVLIQDNRMSKIFQTGIWTSNNDSYAGASTPTTMGNQVDLNVYPPQNTDQIDPNATLFGIVGEDLRIHNTFVGNTVYGDNNGVGSAKQQVGLSINNQTDASGNTFYNLSEGIRSTELDGSAIVDNRFDGCAQGFVVQPSLNGIYNVSRLGCNTFTNSNSSITSLGIMVQQDATINDIGGFGNPAANKFDGLTYGIQNDNSNTPVTYYQTNSPQEAPITGGVGRVTLNTVRVRNLNNYCFSQQGAVHGNGINRVTGLSASYLTAIMDSVRRQLVPPARYRSYLYEVVSYHASSQQLPALETWWATLALPNAAAYRTVGRYLLSAYDAQRATVAAQRVVLGLQPPALLNTELAAQLQLRTVLRHLPQTMPRLVATDSVILRTLAWSGTGVAESATRWLRYFYPRIPVPAPTLPTTLRLAAAHKKGLAESGAVLGAAYPNPAQTEVTIPFQLAQEGQQAELRFTNLLNGRVVVVPVPSTGTERSQRVALASLPAGQYAYQLVVEGQLVAAPQKLLVNP